MKKSLSLFLFCFFLLGFESHASFSAKPSNQAPQEEIRKELEAQLKTLRRFVNGGIEACKSMEAECKAYLSGGADSGFEKKWQQKTTLLGYKFEAIDIYIETAKDTLKKMGEDSYQKEGARELQGLQEKILPWRGYKRKSCKKEFSGPMGSRNPNRKGKTLRFNDNLTQEHPIPHREEADSEYLPNYEDLRIKRDLADAMKEEETAPQHRAEKRKELKKWAQDSKRWNKAEDSDEEE